MDRDRSAPRVATDRERSVKRPRMTFEQVEFTVVGLLIVLSLASGIGLLN